MASSQQTVDYILEQVSQAGEVASRKMFGEYALYCNGKVVALICDDRLFIKPTAAGRAIIGAPIESPPYPGAKPYYEIPGDQWEDRDWVAALVRATADALPLPPPKKRRAG